MRGVADGSRGPRRRRDFWYAAVLLTLGTPGLVVAQQRDTARTAADTLGLRRAVISGPVQDVPIDRNTYVLGPGDVLELAVVGDLNRFHALKITPDGTLIIPAVGVVNVLGLALDEAESKVRERMFRIYRNVEVHLTLAQVRQFKVFVVGDAEQSVQIASATTRVAEVVPETDSEGVLRRNVLLRRASGDSVEVDLARFRQTGDLDANPALREGDVLVLAPIDRTIHVYGRVSFPGVYEYRLGESLAELLRIANGSREFPSGAADSVHVTRFVGPQQREFFAFARAAAVGPRGKAFVLQPFDAVYVPQLSNYMQQAVAVVEGQVVRPGTYPIRPDSTTVRDLIAHAGGFSADASLVGATLRRQPEAVDNLAFRRLQEVPPEFLNNEERRILQVRGQADEAIVVLDFQRLFEEGAAALDVKVRPGDTLTVPRRTDGVRVLGAVMRPGIVPHTRGTSIEHYLSIAGGISSRGSSKDVVVMRAQTGARVGRREASAIYPGDVIIVPFRERVSLLQVLQTTGTILTTVTSLVLIWASLR